MLVTYQKLISFIFSVSYSITIQQISPIKSEQLNSSFKQWMFNGSSNKEIKK